MSFRRILIAVDGGPIALRATRAALDLAQVLDADAAIVHAVEPPVDDVGEFRVPADALPEAAAGPTEELLAALHEHATLPESAPRFLRVGYAAEVILQVAGAWRADLIVIGSHGRQGLDRLMLGSVAQSVVRRAPCAVLVVRQAE